MLWSLLLGARFERLLLVAVVVLVALGEAGAIGAFVARLFAPLNDALGFAL